VVSDSIPPDPLKDITFTLAKHSAPVAIRTQSGRKILVNWSLSAEYRFAKSPISWLFRYRRFTQL